MYDKMPQTRFNQRSTADWLDRDLNRANKAPFREATHLLFDTGD